MSTVIGRPGSHASSLARAALLRAAGFAALAAVTVLAAFRLGVLDVLGPDRGPTAWVGLACVAAAFVAGKCASQHWDSMRRAEIGARSERRVGKVLERTGPAAVIHGAMLGAGGDCDHVAVGPCLIAVETKTGGGKVRTQRGALHAGRRRIPGDPVAQVRRQANALASIAGRPVTAVVCIPDMANRPLHVGDVTICSLDDLSRVAASSPHVIGRGDAEVLARRIHDGEALRRTRRAQRRAA